MASSLHQQQARQPRRRMEHRLPHRTPRAECSPYRLQHSSHGRNKELNLSRAAAESSDMTTTTMFSGEMINEKETLHGLNDRFAGFIEKVRHLEHQNQLLESEIREMKERRRSPSSLEEEHGAELAELRRLLRDVTQQKHRVEAEHQSLEEELAHLGSRYEREARGRADAQAGIAALQRDIGDAYQAKVQLDKKAQSLVDDVDLLKKSHEAEVSRMAAQVQEAAAQQAHRHGDFGKADLTSALRDIRAQLEGHATSDLRQADEGFRAQFARLTEAAESKREALRAGQQEVQECRRSLQAKSMELDCNRGTRDALERQLGEVEDRHNDDILHYQDTIKELENELISAKFDMSAHLREYQDLLNVKMELDVEILSYRKLLEGEETRLSAPASMPYIYRQSPVHTLPCLTRPGGPGRRAEQPQYKFVEEIITETTREIEMSEFEESGSGESPDAGRAEEEGCDDEAERERPEEEAELEDSQSDKHSPDGDTEQASGSQQSQVESAGRLEQGDDDEVEEGSAMDKAEVECQAESTENNDKPTAEITENNDRPTAESAQSEATGICNKADTVKSPIGHEMAKSIEKAADDADKEKDKSASVKSEPPKLEGEKSDSGDETHTVEPTFPKEKIAVTEENKDTKQGLADSSKTQEPSNAIDDSSDLEKDKRTAAKSDMPETPKREGEVSISEDKPQTVEPIFPKETITVTEENKNTKQGLPDSSKTQEPSNAIDDASDLEKGKRTAVKSDMTEPPKGDGEKPNAGDNTQTVDATSPKEKIALTAAAETKDHQEAAPDNSKTQKPSNGQLEDEKSDSGDKTHTVEPIFPKEKIAVTEENKDTKQGLADSSKMQKPSNAIDKSSDLEKDKDTVAKSDMAEPPKGDIEKPNTGDNTKTVDATSLKEKIALTAAAETKGHQEAAPDNNKTQKPSSGKLEDEKSDSEDKTHTVEPIFPKEKIAVTEESKDSSQTQEQLNATDSEKDKHTVAKSDMAEPPKVDGEKSDSEDKPQTVEPISPKEKIAVSTVGNKDTKQGVPDSSKTQEPSNAIDESSDLEKDKRTVSKSDMTEPPKVDGEISISEDKTQTVEPVFPKEKIAVTEKIKVSHLDSNKMQDPSKAIDASDIEKDKRTVAKSDMTEPPKGDGEKPNTGDNTQTVDATSLKEKIALTAAAETKDHQEAAPDNSKTQKPSSGKLEDEKSDSGDKTHTVEPIFLKEKIAVTEESKDSSQTQEQLNATDSEKDKHTAAKSYMAEPPTLDGEKSDSGDKTHTVEPISPKEKIAVSTVENKDTKQGVPDSSKTQEPSNAIEKSSDLEKDKHTVAKSDMAEPPKLESEVSISEDKTQTVEPIFPKEKIAVTEKSKVSQLDSSKTQEPSNTIDDASDLEKDKHTVAKSDMTEPPKVDGEKSVSEDKPQTVEPISPKEKILVSTVENKDTKQGVSDSSKAQKPSIAIDESSDLEKDKDTVAKSDMAEPPKVDGEKSVSEDKTQTVEPISPKEKIVVSTVGNKDTKQGVPDSSKTQEPSIAIDESSDLEKDKHTVAKSDMAEPPKVDGEKSIIGDKTQTVEPVFPKEKIAVTEKSKVSQLDSNKMQDPSNTIDVSDLEKDKCTAVKSDMPEPPKGDGEKPNTGDNTQTVDATPLKEKIALTAATKDPQEGAPDNSKTQKPSSGKLEDEKSDSGDKTHTVEPIFPKEIIALTEESKDSSQTQEQSNAIDSEKDKHTVAKSDMAEPPKLDGEKSISEDKPQTVEPISPKEKIAVTEKSKVSQLNSSKTQEPSNGQLEDEKSDSEDKTHTVEPIFPKEKIAVTEESKDSSQTQEPSIAIDKSSDLEKDKVTKSDMAEPPKLDGEVSISEDKPQTVEPIFPKDNIAITEENKDTKQPDGRKSQEPSKVPEKINNAKEKEEMLKDSAKNKDSGKTTENITEPIEISETKTEPIEISETKTEPIEISETKTEPIEISETKTTSQKEPAGTSTVTVGGLMSEAAKPKTENGFSNGIGGIKAEDNEPIKAVPQLGEAAKEKTNTSI